jgi:uncharacterized protein (DUF58 family)
MTRSRFLSILIYGLIILGFVTLRGQLLALVIPFVAYLGAGLLFGPETPELKATRTLSMDHVSEGAPVSITLSITNEGSRLENLALEDVIPEGLRMLDGERRTIVSLEPGDTVEMTYSISGQRGYYRLPAVCAEASDHLGLFKKRVALAVTSHLFILPPVYKLPQVAIRPRRTRVYPGLIPARKGGPGVEFYGVRAYQSGDAMRWINHRVSARHHQTLFVNEFEQERAVDVGLILDSRRVTNLLSADHSLLEYTIQATATLADSFLKHGNRVGLLVYGGSRNWTFPGYGRLQRARILRALAAVELLDSMVFEELDRLPTRLFPARSQLVLISPLRPVDLNPLISLRAHGYRLLIISPDPIHFEQRILDNSKDVALAVRIARLERAHLFQQLRQAGVQVFEWRVEQPFHQVARQALSRVPIWARGPEIR